MRRTKSFVHHANKKAVRNFDAKKLDPIQKTLSKFNISTVREQTMNNINFKTSNNNRIPDLTDTRYKIIIEHDTAKIHSELGYENERTLKRNADYTRAGLLFAVINADLCKMLCLDESKLAVYLFYHKLMEYNARKECFQI